MSSPSLIARASTPALSAGRFAAAAGRASDYARGREILASVAPQHRAGVHLGSARGRPAIGRRVAGRGAVITRAMADAGQSTSDPVGMTFKYVLLPVIDSNPYLCEGTKQAAATVAKLARDSGCKVTVLMIDKKAEDGDPAVKEETIRWHLNEGGCTDYDLLHREEEKPSVAVGDVADDLECDLVVLSAEAVHGGLVDANLLAEFVPCPIFMIP